MEVPLIQFIACLSGHSSCATQTGTSIFGYGGDEWLVFVAPFTMDPSWQPVMSAAQRRKQRRLRSWYRHEQLTVAAALAMFTHHSAPRGQRTARAREGGSETKNTAEDRRTPPPEEPGTQYYGLDDDDSVPELSGGRPGPVLDPGPPVAGMGRHTGEAFELVLDVPLCRSWAGTSPSRRRRSSSA